MKKMILLVVLGLASPVWAQAPAESKPAAQKPKATKAAKKSTAKRHQDARHCLQRASNDAVIRCAEEYL